MNACIMRGNEENQEESSYAVIKVDDADVSNGTSIHAQTAIGTHLELVYRRDLHTETKANLKKDYHTVSLLFHMPIKARA